MRVRFRVVDVAAKLTADESRGDEMNPLPFDPNPDYDASDEIEFYSRYLTWGLRGVVDGQGYPPPMYPPV
jgi:hypothetical protein